MKMETFKVTNKIDRLATMEEVQTAEAPFRNYVVKGVNEAQLEIPSDRGGYVRFSAEEFELLFLIEELNHPEK